MIVYCFKTVNYREFHVTLKFILQQWTALPIASKLLNQLSENDSEDGIKILDD